jgi:hypothetical protein
LVYAGEHPEQVYALPLSQRATTARAGIEPATEVTRSHATGAVTNCNLRGFSGPGWHLRGQSLPSDWRFPFAMPYRWKRCIPNLRHRRFWLQGKIARGLYRLVSTTKRRTASNRLAFTASPEVSACCATGAAFIHRHEGTIAMRVGSCQDEETASFTTHGREERSYLDCSWIQQRSLCAIDWRRREESSW